MRSDQSESSRAANGPDRASASGPASLLIGCVVVASLGAFLIRPSSSADDVRDGQTRPAPKSEASSQPTTPTYAAEVSRIIQKNCQECHRKGQVGPFVLETYEHARKRAHDIARVTSERAMPPWKAVRGFGKKFQHDRSLSEAEIATLTAWAEAGAPLGDPALLPPAASFPDGWDLGMPDLVLEIPEVFAVPATGTDIYRCFVLPTSLPADTYISAIEYRPDNRRVVHHILGWVDTTGAGRKKDAADPGPGYSCFSGPEVQYHGDFGGWSVGRDPARLPEGVAYSVPKGSDVILQIHYHPDGRPETDRSKVGLHFARSPTKQTVHRPFAFNAGLLLLPGKANIEVKASWTVPVDLVALAVTPHMHKVGRDMAMMVTYPDGRTDNLIKIADWDFGWQNSYFFEQPVDLPRGSVVKVLAHYDNSANNPHNPNKPPRLVTWGPATTDEMCIGFITVTKKHQDLTKPSEKDDLEEIIRQARRRRGTDPTSKVAIGE
jgi:Copper type II ascorbate-dependent monooxygenase, C-terminal domain